MIKRSKIKSKETATMTQVTISLGERLPGYEPDNFSGLEPSIASGQFRLRIFAPHLSAREIQMFNSGGKLIAIRERHLLYLCVCFGELSAESSYSVYKDAPSAWQVGLPRLENLPEGEAPLVQCMLIDSATGVVVGMRICCPPGFSRTWLAAIDEQKKAPYDEEEEVNWGRELILRYPTTDRFAAHPHAVVGVVRS